MPGRAVGSRCIWIHGVSLGEINATRTLVDELRRRSPEMVVIISSTTRTGLDRARSLYPKLPVFRFPLDFSFAIRSVIGRMRPSAIVLMELEIWPNLVEVAGQQGIPVFIANGRITTEKSVRRFSWPIVRIVARRMFSGLRWVGAQDHVYAQRFIEIGVPLDRVAVVGSLKYDSADVADRIEGQDELADAMGIDRKRPLWVCGSTGPGEEAAILAAHTAVLKHFPDLQLAIIPRKPERFEEVAKLVVSSGYACLRRSTGVPVLPAAVAEPRPVFLGDTMGELRKFYALASVVFVGRTLVPMGGSDVMEVAGLAKPIIVGPHCDNFSEAIALLLSEQAVRQIPSAELLAPAVQEFLRHPDRGQRMGRQARMAIISRRGATAKTVDEILAVIG